MKEQYWLTMDANGTMDAHGTMAVWNYSERIEQDSNGVWFSWYDGKPVAEDGEEGSDVTVPVSEFLQRFDPCLLKPNGKVKIEVETKRYFVVVDDE